MQKEVGNISLEKKRRKHYKFILSRINDKELHSKKWIVGYGLLFWLVSRIVCTVLIVICVIVYEAFGVDPKTLTKFAGSPEETNTFNSLIYGLMSIAIIAPLMEESIFRLGLSFKKWQIALGISSIPLYLLIQKINHFDWFHALQYFIGSVIIFSLIYFSTSKSFWIEQKILYYKTAIWLSAIAFGLIHLIAFSNSSLLLIPYMLCVITVPFFAGCAITYYRINLGFWWSVGLHIFNNIPPFLIMILNFYK